VLSGDWVGGGGWVGEQLDENEGIEPEDQASLIEICFILFLSTIILETANIYSLVN